jgi:hypothetical protein
LQSSGFPFCLHNMGADITDWSWLLPKEDWLIWQPKVALSFYLV